MSSVMDSKYSFKKGVGYCTHEKSSSLMQMSKVRGVQGTGRTRFKLLSILLVYLRPLLACLIFYNYPGYNVRYVIGVR